MRICHHIQSDIAIDLPENIFRRSPEFVAFMDANRACNGYRWTNERHLNFLKSVEASFVRTMLGNGDGGLLSMDRRVPDSYDSTLDSEMVIGRKKRKRRFLGDDLDASLGMDQRVRRLRPHFPQDDQVVPQMKHVKNDECDKN